MTYFLITAALNIPNLTKDVSIVRNKEYKAAIDKLLTYTLPIYCVTSEIDGYTYENPLTDYSFKKQVIVPSTTPFHAISKSQKEFICIQKLIEQVDDIHENDMIVKLSGRYILQDDSFMNRVQSADTSVGCICKKSPDGQMYTFCYAVRWKYLKDFFTSMDNFHAIRYKNVERHFHEYLQKECARIEYVDTLSIYANINNEGILFF